MTSPGVSRDVTGSSISGGRSLTVSIIHNIDAARLYNEVRHLDVNKRRENNYKTWKHQVTIEIHIFCDVNLGNNEEKDELLLETFVG